MRLLPALLAPAVMAATLSAADPTDNALPRSSPEAQGIPSSAILAFIDAAEQQVDALHSVMILRHGHVVAEGWWEPYRREDPHQLYSLSKSFASTAVGLAVHEGKLSVDDLVLDFFPEDAPSDPSDNLKAMRVRDLLTMNTGHHDEDLDTFSFSDTEVPLTRAFLALPVAHKPGTHFLYNTPATYMLSAIVQKVTGRTLLDYLGPRLFEPLGIEDPTWGTSPQGITLGGFGLSITTEGIARFGQLYLQKGQWQGRQLIPEAWVEAATSRQTANGSSPTSDWEQGYGYQFWRCRHGLYRGDGAFGQFAIVMPEQDAVVAITSGTPNMGAVMNLVWEHLLPNMKAGALPDEALRTALTARLEHLSLPVVDGRPTSPRAAQISNATFEFPANDAGMEAVRLSIEGDRTSLLFRLGGRDQVFPVGMGEWRREGTLRLGTSDEPVATSGAWTAEDTFTATLCLYETPFCRTATLRFDGDRLLLDSKANVAFGPTETPQLIGRLRK